MKWMSIMKINHTHLEGNIDYMNTLIEKMLTNDNAMMRKDIYIQDSNNIED